MARRPMPMRPLSVGGEEASGRFERTRKRQYAKLSELSAEQQAAVRERLAHFWLYVRQVRAFEAHEEEALL